MSEPQRRKELLDRIVKDSGGNDDVRALLAAATVGELEAAAMAAEDKGLTHLQAAWKRGRLGA